MKITGVRTQRYDFDLKRPIGDANNPSGASRVSNTAVQVDTDEGLTGVAVGAGAADALIRDLGESLLVGEDPRGVRGLWQRMVNSAFKGNNRGLINDAICALDVALWDLKAKANEEPLWRTLGAIESQVPAYASGIDLNLSDAALGEFYRSMAELGISAGKLKVGRDIEADCRRLEIMRDALASKGATPSLMIDSNEYWSPKQSIRHIKHLEQHFDLVWAEEPARRWDYRGLRKVSQSVNAAVATGENLDDLSEFVPLVEQEAVDILQFNHGCSGITGALRVADLAHGFEIPIAMMCCPASFMAHVAAAIPNHMMMEYIDVGLDTALRHDHRVENGQIHLSAQPGLGIEFDQAKLDELAAVPANGTRPRYGWGRPATAGLDETRGPKP